MWRIDSFVLIIIWAIFNIVSTVGGHEQHAGLPQMSFNTSLISSGVISQQAQWSNVPSCGGVLNLLTRMLLDQEACKPIMLAIWERRFSHSWTVMHWLAPSFAFVEWWIAFVEWWIMFMLYFFFMVKEQAGASSGLVAVMFLLAYWEEKHCWFSTLDYTETNHRRDYVNEPWYYMSMQDKEAAVPERAGWDITPRAKSLWLQQMRACVALDVCSFIPSKPHHPFRNYGSLVIIKMEKAAISIISGESFSSFYSRFSLMSHFYMSQPSTLVFSRVLTVWLAV